MREHLEFSEPASRRRRTPARRSSPPPASASSSPTTWSRAPGPPDAAGTTPRLEPYGPISLDPAAAVLHYAQEIFEGLKAYRHADGSVWTFRPEANAARLHPLRPAAGAARAARGRTSSPRSRRSSDRRRLGADARRDEPVPAAVHVRLRGVPRRAAGRRDHVHGDRLAGRALLPRRGEAGLDLAVAGVHPRRARRHRRGQVRRQLRREPAAAVEATAHGCDQVCFLDASSTAGSRSSAG